MGNVIIDAAKCPADHACPLLGICPVEAITQEGFAAPQIDQEKCIACGMCTSVCAFQAADFE